MVIKRKEKRTTELRILLQESLYQKLKEKAGEYRTISELVREVLVKYVESEDK